MVLLRRLRICKATGAVLAVILLSSTFARWKAFFQAPAGASYAALVLVLSLLLGLMAALAVVVYAEEKARGRITRPRPWFDRCADRFFLKADGGVEGEHREPGEQAVPPFTAKDR